MTHAPEHEDLLRRLLTGDGAGRGDAEVLLGECPECRAELARLRACEQDVVRLAGGMKADWRAASAQAGAGDRELMRAGLLRVVRTRRQRRWMLTVAVAAGLLVLAGIAWMESGEAPAQVQEYMLSDGKIRLLAPLGDGGSDAYGSFEWERELPPRTHFRLSFYRYEGGKRGEELDTIVRREPRWTPTPEEERALPSQIVWRVDLIDETTDISLEHAEGMAQR